MVAVGWILYGPGAAAPNVSEVLVVAKQPTTNPVKPQVPLQAQKTPIIGRVAGTGEKGIAKKIAEMMSASTSTNEPRVFVEMGANDGINSNTHYLEQNFGWTGLCIEGGESNFQALQTNRPHCTNVLATVGAQDGSRVFREFPVGSTLYGHSGFVDTRSSAEWDSLRRGHAAAFAQVKDRQVQVTTLATIFREKDVTKIDYFSLDVEGAEMEVLNVYPWQEVPVHIWTIESNKLDREKLLTFMTSKGYTCFHFDAINTICEKKA